MRKNKTKENKTLRLGLNHFLNSFKNAVAVLLPTKLYHAENF